MGHRGTAGDEPSASDLLLDISIPAVATTQVNTVNANLKLRSRREQPGSFGSFVHSKSKNLWPWEHNAPGSHHKPGSNALPGISASPARSPHPPCSFSLHSCGFFPSRLRAGLAGAVLGLDGERGKVLPVYGSTKVTER